MIGHPQGNLIRLRLQKKIQPTTEVGLKYHFFDVFGVAEFNQRTLIGLTYQRLPPRGKKQAQFQIALFLRPLGKTP
ncbi:hypothetical protein D3C81_2039560 [compost metagenome]